MLLSSHHARSHPVIGEAIRKGNIKDDDALALLLMFSKINIDDASLVPHHHHIRLLPEISRGEAGYYQLLFWEDEEIEYLQGTKAYPIACRVAEDVRQDYIALVSTLFQDFPDVFSLFDYTLRLYQWALATIWSRGMDCQLHGSQNIRLICPVGDMFNHKDMKVSCCHYLAVESTAEGVTTLDHSFLGIIAGESVSVGEEICINYGSHHCNAKLLHLYGFAMEENPAEYMEFWVPLDPSSPNAELKLSILESYGIFNNTTPFQITLKEPLPIKLVLSLAVVLDPPSGELEREKLEIIFTEGVEALSKDHLSVIRNALLGGFEVMLDGYPDSLNVTLQEYQTEKTFGGFDIFRCDSERYKYIMALITRLGEMNIIHTAIKTTESLLNRVDD